MLGSVIAANPTATSYFLACPSDYDCGFHRGLYWLEGPSTVSYLNEAADNKASCVLTLGTVQSARCTDVAVGEGHVLTTDTYEYGHVSTWLHPVTITGGLEKIRAVGTTGSGDGGGTRTSAAVNETSDGGSDTSSSNSASEMTTAVSPTGTGTATTTGSALSSSTSEAGMAAVTVNARVVAGVAAVFGGVLVL